MLGNFVSFLSFADCFKFNGLKNSIWVLNSLDPDQARQFVRPDLFQNCLQKLSVDNASRPAATEAINRDILFYGDNIITNQWSHH